MAINNSYINEKSLKKILSSYNICDSDELFELLLRLKEHDLRTFVKSVNTMKTVAGILCNERMSEKKKSEILLGALLHDIGNLYIDKNVLSTTGPISVEDYQEIKKHTLYGVDILKNYPSLLTKTVKNIVLYHHEINGGKGYPFELQKVPYEAQIVGAVSAYRAMANESRRYIDPSRALITLSYEGVSDKIVKLIQVQQKAISI